MFRLQGYVNMVIMEREIGRGENFPVEYQAAFESLWSDDGVKYVVQRGNEFALHDNLT
jgi:guanine nucleotide-binding protein subunit alpha